MSDEKEFTTDDVEAAWADGKEAALEELERFEHQETMANRYSMVIDHQIKNPGHNRIELLCLDRQDPKYYLFEARCISIHCDWWDHWDERKEDWE